MGKVAGYKTNTQKSIHFYVLTISAYGTFAITPMKIKYLGINIVKVKSLSRVQLFATSWTVAYQVPQSMGFSRQDYWSGLPFPSPGDLPDPGIEPRSPAL